MKPQHGWKLLSAVVFKNSGNFIKKTTLLAFGATKTGLSVQCTEVWLLT